MMSSTLGMERSCHQPNHPMAADVADAVEAAKVNLAGMAKSTYP